MINGLTIEEYSRTIADFCEKTFSIREIWSNSPRRRSAPVTQFVACRLDSGQQDDASIINMNHMLIFTRWRGSGKDTFESIFNRKDTEFHAYIEETQTIKDSVYDALINDAGIQQYSNNDLTINDIWCKPSLMFITTIRCKPFEDYNDVREAYISKMACKYGIMIPEALVIVNTDIEHPDLTTSVKFVAGNGAMPLAKEALKRK